MPEGGYISPKLDVVPKPPIDFDFHALSRENQIVVLRELFKQTLSALKRIHNILLKYSNDDRVLIDGHGCLTRHLHTKHTNFTIEDNANIDSVGKTVIDICQATLRNFAELEIHKQYAFVKDTSDRDALSALHNKLIKINDLLSPRKQIPHLDFSLPSALPPPCPNSIPACAPNGDLFVFGSPLVPMFPVIRLSEGDTPPPRVTEINSVAPIAFRWRRATQEVLSRTREFCGDATQAITNLAMTPLERWRRIGAEMDALQATLAAIARNPDADAITRAFACSQPEGWRRFMIQARVFCDRDVTMSRPTTLPPTRSDAAVTPKS